MNTQSLLFGIVGFLLGGLVVSIAATQLDEDNTASGSEMTMRRMSEDLADKSGEAFDAAFITSMIEPHEGAIDMAELAKTQANHDEIRQLAQAILAAQASEIAQMRQWQQQWGYDESANELDHSLPYQ